MKKKLWLLPMLFLLVTLLALSISPQAFASGATIALSPSSGSYNKTFPVSVVIDGGGDVFNAAQVAVTVSQNLSIQDLTTGDCNFSFLQTPTITNPSFAGVLLGKSSKHCTAYTMTLAPIAKGTGTITLSKGSVRRFGDAVNILSTMTSATYNLTGTVKVTPLPTIAPSKGNLYSVLLTVFTGKNMPVKNTTVSLQSVAVHTPQKAATDANGRVQFTNLQPGIYNAIVTDYPGDHILNVTGSNHTLILGLTLQPQQGSILKSISNPFVLVGILVIGVILGGGLSFVLWKKTKRFNQLVNNV